MMRDMGAVKASPPPRLLSGPAPSRAPNTARSFNNKMDEPVGQDITLTASDGFKLGAYRTQPEGKPKGAVVVIQEIFGVNSHIRTICDRFAVQGYVAIAPSIFDRVEPNFQ